VSREAPRHVNDRDDAAVLARHNPASFRNLHECGADIVERGFAATSVNDIASASAEPRPAYHYIASKEALFFDVVSLGMDWLEEEVVKHVVHPGSEERSSSRCS
jgi:AcrR family transcriptional regulator